MLGQFSPEGPGAAALAHLPRSGIRAYLELFSDGARVLLGLVIVMKEQQAQFELCEYLCCATC